MIEKTKLLRLFDECFPGLSANIVRCERVGFDWSSRPFVKCVGGEIVSHVGVLDYPIFIEGCKHSVGALHAICTDAAHRSQGFASELVQQAIEWSKDRYESLVLFTDIPSFYEKRSFRSIQEYRFHLVIHHPGGKKPLFPVTSPKDDAEFIRFFSERTATSSHFWVEDRGNIAAFNTLYATYPSYWSLHFCPAIDAMVSFEIMGKTLYLYDILSRKMPSLEQILDHMPAPIDEVFFSFSPELLTGANCTPIMCDSSMGYFMVQGKWPDVLPFTISPLSRC